MSAAGEVQIKDLVRGAELSGTDEALTASHADYVRERKGQITVPRSQMVDGVRAILARRT